MREFSIAGTKPAMAAARRMLKAALACLPLFSLVACGGGGGDGPPRIPPPPPPPTNNAPVPDAGTDQTVFENITVNLAGSATDTENDPLTYTWSQTAGTTVTLTGADTQNASFTSPDVAAGSPETLTFQLQVGDGTNTATDTVDITVEENEPPVANAGPDANVFENSTATLDGTGSSDPNAADTLTYSWVQTSGVAVTLNNADTAQPTFTAPDVLPLTTEVLDFELTVSDGVNNDTDAVQITVEEGQPFVTVSGTVSYEFVPPNPACLGLNFAATTVMPIRGATVQLLDVSANPATVIDSTVASDTGGYSFSNVAAATDVRLRVLAELKRTGTPAWDVEVRDNVDTSGSPPPLQSRPLYAVDGTDFNTGGADVTRDLTATTGWGGASYTGPRSAAPFAILDAFYSAMQLVLTADAGANFSELDAYWSVNNTLMSPTNIDAGELGASFYTSNPDGGPANPSLFLLGDAAVDTEEFDDHIVVHEWGHYFEDNFSRSDSTGGPHALGQSVDARLAFGEGWATALAGMALNNPQYCDTGAAGSTSGFGINAESDGFGLQGWYNEISVTTFLYDLWDTDDDGADDNSIGFQPIFDTMAGPQATTAAFTTLFSFAAELRPMLNATEQAFMDAQLVAESVNATGLDIWGSAATNDAGGGRDVLPLYTALPIDGSTLNICTNSDYDSDRDGNKLAELRYLTIDVATASAFDIAITTVQPTTPPLPADDPNNPTDQSDPDMFIQQNGTFIAVGQSGDANSEVFTTPTMQPGRYVAELQEFRYIDDDTATDFPEQICFDITMTPNP